MEVPKVGIVILNYKKYEEAEACINSSLIQTGIDLTVVVVDNGSGNESVDYLEKQFDDCSKVHIISLPQNVGYAKGNNIGIEYLCSKGINYICLANSDIVFSTERILYQMLCGYQDDVGIVLPIIKNPNGMLDQRVSYKRKYILLRILKAIVIRQMFAYDILKRLSFTKTDKARNMREDTFKSGIQYSDYVITGSIFMLTPGFFKYYTQLFPETFLYFEEWATILFLHKAKLICNIVDTDVVLHKGGASTPDIIKQSSPEKMVMIAESGRKVAKLIFMSQKGISKRYGFGRN